MAVTFVNASNIQPLVNQEVVVATIAGPLDNLDAYVSGGAWSDGTIVFFIYATVGAVRARVAVGIFGGPTAARITWKNPSGDPIEGSVHAGGTSYDLVVFAQPNQSYQPATPAPIQATFAGVDQGDVAADANASGTALTGATIATATGFNQFADVSARMAGLPGTIFQLLASCGAGSVEAIVETAQTGGPDATAVVMKGVVLPVATSYRIVAQPAQPGTSFSVTASLSTYFTSSNGGSGVVILAGNTSGPSNANITQYATWESVDQNVVVDSLPAANQHGLTFFGMLGLTTLRSVTLSSAPKDGDVAIVKAQDTTFENFDIVINGNGFPIDGATNYTLTISQNGPRGAVTLLFVDGEWAVVAGQVSAGLASLAYWLRADLGITMTQVVTWLDQSGAGDSNRNFTQASFPSRPFFIASEPLFNGQSVLRFTSTGHTYLDQVGPWSDAPVNAPFTMIVIGRDNLPSPVGHYPWIGDDVGPGATWYQASFENPAVSVQPQFMGSSTGVGLGTNLFSTSPDPGTPLVLMSEFNDNSSTIRLNSDTASQQEVGGVPGQTGLSILSPLRIGGAFGTGNELDGDIAEIIIYNGILSSTDRQALLEYVHERYAIAVSGIPGGTIPAPPNELPSGTLPRLWLRADLGIIGQVSAWADQSGNGEPSAVQATLPNQPLWHQNLATINNQAGLAFINSPFAWLGMAAPWINAPPQPYTMIVVGSDGNSGSEAFLGDLLGNNWYLAALSGTYGASVGASLLGTTPDSTVPKVFYFEAHDPNSTIRVNELTPEATGNAGFASPIPQLQIAGALGGGAAPLNPGVIAEVRIYRGLLTSAQRTQVLTDLGARYGIVIGP